MTQVQPADLPGPLAGAVAWDPGIKVFVPISGPGTVPPGATQSAVAGVRIQAGAFPVPNNAATALVWSTSNVLNNAAASVFNTATNGITVLKAGLYLAIAKVRYPNSATGIRRDVTLTLNGAAFAPPSGDPMTLTQATPILANVDAYGILSNVLSLAVNDVLSVQLFQDTGATSNPNACSLTLALLGT